METSLREFIGWQGKDKITGLSGVITGAALYITGCNQLCLCVVKDNSYVNHWLDINRIDIDYDQPRVSFGSEINDNGPGEPPDKA